MLNWLSQNYFLGFFLYRNCSKRIVLQFSVFCILPTFHRTAQFPATAQFDQSFCSPLLRKQSCSCQSHYQSLHFPLLNSKAYFFSVSFKKLPALVLLGGRGCPVSNGSNKLYHCLHLLSSMTHIQPPRWIPVPVQE